MSKYEGYNLPTGKQITKEFIRNHPTEVVVGVALVSLCVGWKLRTRTAIHAFDKIGKDVVELGITEEQLNLLAENAGQMVWKLPKVAKKVTRVTLAIDSAVKP